jgi:hypothetical protein
MSQKQEHPIIPVPSYCLSDKGPAFPRTKSRDRVEYLAEKSNKAVKKALELYPFAEHILWIDSYYLQQSKAIRILLNEYGGHEILGGSVWARVQTRIPSWTQYYDTWSVPESRNWKYRLWHRIPKGIVPVTGVGAVYVAPRWAFERIGYGIPEPFPESGCHHNYLCKNAGLPIALSFNARFWRDHTNSDYPYYGPTKRVRLMAGYWKQKLLHHTFL